MVQFLKEFERSRDKEYISSIKRLEKDTVKTGIDWLQGIVDSIVKEAESILSE